MITTDVDRERDLTVYTVTGKVVDREAAFALLAAWESSPTLNSLWDLRNANADQVGPDEVRWIGSTIAKHGAIRKGGKAAVVAPREIEHFLGSLGKSAFEQENPAYQAAVFRDMEAALAWLGVPEKAGPSAPE
jgi:hypothetical protein